MKVRGRLAVLVMCIIVISLGLTQALTAASKDSTRSIPEQAPPAGVLPEQIERLQPAPENLREEIPDWEARWELARLLSYAKHYEESLSEYRLVTQEKPELWQVKTEMARVMFWSGRQLEAVKVLEEIPPGGADDSARLLMADLYVTLKAFSKAEPIYRAHLKSHPKDLEVAVKLAEILSWTKRYEEAIVFYKDALNARPEDIQLRRKYAYTLIWAGRQSEAVIELKKTLK